MGTNGMPGAGKSVTSGNIFDQMTQAGKLVFDGRVPFSLKLMLPIAAILYWLWPLDLMPGLPFDDLAVLFIALTFFVQLANQAIEKQAQQQQQYNAGSGAQANPGAANSTDVVDTTWRVIE